MLENYLKIAFRNLLRNRTFSVINILGLAIGITGCLLILLYVTHEVSFDRFNKNYECVYRTATKLNFSGKTMTVATASDKLGPALKQNFPEVRDYVRLFDIGSFMRQLVRCGDKAYYTEKLMFADSSFFTFFSYKLLEGNPSSVLSAPYSIVITKPMAVEYFGNEDPIGRILQLDEGDTTFSFAVTGIAAEPPSNSSLQFSFLPSFSTLYTNWWKQHFVIDRWGAIQFYTYIKLAENYPVKDCEAKLPSFIGRQLKGDPDLGTANVSVILQPLKDIHMFSHLDFDLASNISVQPLYILSAIAFFLLLIACVNFINLSTARYMKRSKEISVRKVLGAERVQLVRQFLAESIITSVLATAIGFMLVEIFIPYAKGLTGTSLSLHFSNVAMIAATFGGIAIVTGLLAGLFPALFLSSLSPVSIFKKTMKSANLGDIVRKSLVVFQFTISIALIASAIILQNQLSYVQNSNLGFNKKDLVVVQLCKPLWQGDAMSRFNAYRAEIESDPNIRGTTAAYGYPGNMAMRTNFQSMGKNGKEIMMNWDPVDSNYMKVFGIQLESGTSFSESHARNPVIINESAEQEFGLGNPIGKQLMTGTGLGNCTIVGVVKNFNYRSLRSKIDPLILVAGKPDRFQYLICKINPRSSQRSLRFLKEKWQAIYPGYPFDYSFLDADLGRLYVNDERFGGMVNVFAALAVAVACLGLFGLASFSVQERTKEIGIRKVLGASVVGIMKLLSGEFMKVVLLANLIAWPVAYYFMTTWLQGFAYRTGISIWIFLLAGGIALFVATATVGIQVVKAATANPAESLRYE